MSKWILKIEAEFDTKGSAEDALSDMEDAVGKNNGELIDSEIEHPEDDQPVRPPCCMCGEPATVLDTEYNEAYCDTHAREYRVTSGPYRLLEDNEADHGS